MNKLLICCTLGSNVAFTVAQSQEARPNIVWFMTEDVSSYYLSMYNDDGQGASTPNVRKMAQEGIVFNNAFCNAPVSSSARSTLITGCYANKLGVVWHRKVQTVDLPADLKMFPAYLNDAGYYTSNSTKKDYNCMETPQMWNDGKAPQDGWRNRPDKTKPFFHVLTSTLSHESSSHFPLNSLANKKTIYDPDKVVVAPNHPNTELFRYTYAKFFDDINRADAKLGEMMDKLKADGELDNTFIFYFGDNGGILPGTKGYTTERGLHVPLVVYIPKKWRDKINLPIASRVNGFVSFVDFAPTMLHLAGLDVPDLMDGKTFLGTGVKTEELESRDETYGYGDRFDELYSHSRTLRKGNFKYRRNFQPYQPEGLFAYYRYNMQAFMEWRRLFDEGKLNASQRRFFEPQKAEELYDISNDPYELTNLALQPEFSSKLLELRTKLADKMISLNDVGMYPESEWIEKAGATLYLYADKHSNRIKEYISIANLMLLPFEQVKKQLASALSSNDPVTKYWALTVCASFGKEAESLKKLALPLLNDESVFVNSRAVVFLSVLNEIDTQKEMVSVIQKAKTLPQKLLVLNDAAFLKDQLKYTFDFSEMLDLTEIYLLKRAEYLSGKKFPQKKNTIKKQK